MVLKLTLAPLLLSALTVSATPGPPVQVRWVEGSGDRLKTVDGHTVVEYRNAGAGGIEWTLAGTGQAGGNSASQLWLYTAPKRATVALSAATEAVAFMMAGDYNDGVATFLVDGVEIDTFDMFHRGERTIIVEGLPRAAHVLEAVAEGRKQARSMSTHIALYGGAALDAEPIAAENRAPNASPDRALLSYTQR